MQPLEFMFKELIKIPAEVNGEQLNFVLDSGAAWNVFSRNTLDTLQWEYHESHDDAHQAQGIGGKVSS